MIAEGCGCCGRAELREGEMTDCITTWPNGVTRCSDHQKRNPCAIDGCKRTHAAPTTGELSDKDWLCPVHWRRYVPPRSRRRRAYHSFWRKAAKEGWHADLRRRFWRFWEALVASARARHAAGTLDVAEINRIMGWDNDDTL